MLKNVKWHITATYAEINSTDNKLRSYKKKLSEMCNRKLLYNLVPVYMYIQRVKSVWNLFVDIPRIDE